MISILTLLLFLSTAATAAVESVSVYQLTGAIQCIEGTGILPEAAADLLRGQGVTVISAERRKLPQEVGKSCGAPVEEANVMKVSAADWTNFVAKNPDAGGYGLWVFDDGTVQVYKYDGTLQCGMGHELTLDEMAQELEAEGVEVIASRKGTDGLLHITVCGASTGSINVFVIDRGSLPTAQRLGYRLLVTHEMTDQIKSRAVATDQSSLVVQPVSTDSDNPDAEKPGTNKPQPAKQPLYTPVPLLW